MLRGYLPRQDASLLMGGFRWLRRQRFEGLVRGYLAHVCMKEAEETLEQRQGSCDCVKAHTVLGRLRGLRQQVGLARTALQPCFPSLPGWSPEALCSERVDQWVCGQRPLAGCG